jgi:hypothetical protein
VQVDVIVSGVGGDGRCQLRADVAAASSSGPGTPSALRSMTTGPATPRGARWTWPACGVSMPCQDSVQQNSVPYGCGAPPRIAAGLVVMSSPLLGRILRGALWRLRTGHSARTRSRDQSPATTRRPVPGTGFRAVPPVTGKDRPSERRHSTASEQGSAPAVSKQLSRSRKQSRRSCGQCRSRFRER